ncbi:MAG: site-2 protease family protein [Armatimonadota bacterium]
MTCSHCQNSVPLSGACPACGTAAAPALDFDLAAGTSQPARPAASPTASTPAAAQSGWVERLKVLGPIGVSLFLLAGKLKSLASLKFVLPVLQTSGTMLLSAWYYATLWGWPFGLGFVLSILVHEMGHVFAAARFGVPVSAPFFIPGFGALILQKRAAKSPFEEAVIGIGGPIGGTLAGLACLGLYGLTGSGLFLSLAYFTFLLNLFNLAPIFPLDGGWITGAVSPRIWLVGVVVMIAGYATGMLRNPLLILLVLLSLPRLWHGLRHGDVTPEGGTPVTSSQRVVMGVAYVALCSLLLWLVSVTFTPIP